MHGPSKHFQSFFLVAKCSHILIGAHNIFLNLTLRLSESMAKLSKNWRKMLCISNLNKVTILIPVPLSSTQGPHLFSSQTRQFQTSVQHNCVRSTRQMRYFHNFVQHKGVSSTKNRQLNTNALVQHNKSVSSTHNTDAFWGWKGVAPVFNWRGCGTERYPFNSFQNTWTKIAMPAMKNVSHKAIVTSRKILTALKWQAIMTFQTFIYVYTAK